MIARPSPPVVSFIIVSWNQWEVLRRCLSSVLASKTAVPLEIIVVDNGSMDGTAEALRTGFPSVRCVRLDTNRGFAAANNRGVEVGTANLLFLLNNDTVVDPTAVDALVDAARRFPMFDIFAPQMIRLRDEARVDNRGIYVSLAGHCRQLDAGTPVRQQRARCEVFGASGGACLIRRSVVEEIGLFDETLGSYLEDCDFAFRALATGHRCLYEPEARILHEGSLTGDLMPDYKYHQIQRNMRIVRSRWLAPRPWGAVHWMAKAYDGYRLAKAIFQHRYGALLRANREAAGISSPFAKWSTPTAKRRVEKWLGQRAKHLIEVA